ncbi:MAG: hypothetical protein ACOYYS_22770 [Chloroflexota bacterium]
MKQKKFLFYGLLLVLQIVILMLLLPNMVRADPNVPQAGAPSMVNYQGYLADADGSPLDGAHTLTFGVYAAASGGTALWEDTFSSVQVNKGYFNVVLGSQTGKPLGANVFGSPATWLQIAVDGAVMAERLQFAAVPYALQAQSAPWSGLSGMPAGFADGSDAGQYQNVKVVAKTGGDYTTITAALNSIGDASESNRYLVWVAPGQYEEVVTMKPYVDIVGASRNTARIFVDDTTTTAAVIAASHATLKSIGVENYGVGSRDAEGVHCAGVVDFVISDVKSVAQNGNRNYGVYAINASEVYITDSELVAIGTATNTYGVYGSGSTVRVVQSRLVGAFRSAFNEDNATGSVYVALSEFNSDSTGATNVRCTGVYNESYRIGAVITPVYNLNACPP